MYRINYNEIIYKPIGIIHSPFKTIEGVPIQPAGAKGTKGEVKVYKKYSTGLKSLEGFSHIILIYHFHLSEGYKLKVVPFMDVEEHGVFATRAPKRPNPVGISVVKINSIKDNTIEVDNIDIIDGTPLLDIKPYISRFDNITKEKNGWYSKSGSDVSKTKADKRFK
jgi:tRNA (adenine37-N6)-methyltransferase